MYDVSELFKQYINASDRSFKVKATINNVEYDDKRIIQYDLEESLTENAVFSIGSVISNKLTIQVKTEDIIAANAQITPYLQLTGADEDTEWVPVGKFYVDKRTKNRGVYEFTAYDKLICANQLFDSSLTYPASMQEVFDEILSILDIEADGSAEINPAYDVPYKDEDITINEILSYIASAHAACFKISKDGKLKMVKPAAVQTPITIGRSLYTKVTKTNPVKTITKLRCIYNLEGEYLEVGTGTEATTLEFTNMYITEDILTDIYNQLNGFSYLPISMPWKGNPSIEPGDAITVSELTTLTWEDAAMAWEDANFRWDGQTSVTTIILENKSTFRGGLRTVSVSESDTEQESEFPFEGQLKRAVQKMVQKDIPYYGVTIGRSKGIHIKRSDGYGEVMLNSDKFEFKANGTQQLYFDIAKKKFIFNGELSANIINAITVSADKITAGTLSGVTINVDTDAIVGNKIRLGTTSSNVILENSSGDFYLSRNNNKVLKFWSNYLGINGGIVMQEGYAISLFTSGFTGSTGSEILKMYFDRVQLGTGQVVNLDMNGNNILNAKAIQNSSRGLSIELGTDYSPYDLSILAKDISIGKARIYSGSNNLKLSTYSSSYDIILSCGDLDISAVSRIYSTSLLRLYSASQGIKIEDVAYKFIELTTNGALILNAGGYNYGIKLNSTYIGFFGKTPTSKTAVADLSTLATPEQTRAKVIELIDVLQSYGLI